MAKERKDLGYLGEEFQYKLVHTFMEDKEFFKDLSSIIDQNMFTHPQLKIIVGEMKNYYEKREQVPSYDTMGIILSDRAFSDIEKEEYLANLKKIYSLKDEDREYIKDLSLKFFKQQNIIKTANEILRIAGDGNTEKYEQCVELLSQALNQGTHTEFGSTVFEGLGETLSDDYRTPIPTGVDKLDECLEGGLGKGELGVIIGSSSFGKAQPLDSRILTPNGFKLMGEMKIGDYVIGRDGNPYMVSGVFPQGIRPIYKVSFANGTSCECDIEHLWNVGKRYSKKIKTKTLKEIIEKGIVTNTKRPKFYIPMCKSIHFNENDDICFSNKRNEFLQFHLKENSKISKGKKYIKHYTEDKELHDKLVFIARSLGMWVSSQYKKKSKKYLMKISRVNDESLFITNIEYVGEKEAQCIMVDSDEHLYLTEDFIVTHNTSLTTAMASHAATYKCSHNNYHGYKVLQIVFEDRIKQIQRKHIGRITEIEAKDLSKPDVKNIVEERLKSFKDKDILEQNLRIVRFPSGEITASKLERFVKKMINSGFKPDMMIVDYFECLEHISDGRASNEWEKEGKTMRKLESMAAEMDMAIWIPTQGTRDSVNMELVTMDKAGGSFKKIQIAHIVVSIARTMEDIEANKATIALLKNRAGKSGKVFNNVNFNNGTCIISTDDCDDDFNSLLDFNEKKKKSIQDLTKEMAKAMRK